MLYKKFISPSVSLIIMGALVIGFSAVRALGVLGPSSLRWVLPLSFCVMAILPWALLTANGRRQIGLQRPDMASRYILAIVTGAGAALLCFALGYLLFGKAVDNWFVNIGNSYKAMMDTSAMSFWMLSLIFTIPAMLFSPIGEEVFYRGQLQKTLEQTFSINTSTVIECTLFALIHQVHHGIIKSETGLTYLPLSGALWFVLMFLVAWMFAWLRARSGSIYISILSHMVFNIAMNTCIFLFLW